MKRQREEAEAKKEELRLRMRVVLMQEARKMPLPCTHCTEHGKDCFFAVKGKATSCIECRI